jgi:hypothetical protein
VFSGAQGGRITRGDRFQYLYHEEVLRDVAMIFIEKLRQFKRFTKQWKYRKRNTLGMNVTIAPGAMLSGVLLKEHSRITLGASVENTMGVLK